MADTCATCGEPAATPAARWCGHCGARLGGDRARRRPRATATGAGGADRPPDGALVGAGTTALLVDDRPDGTDEVTPTAPAWSRRARIAAVVGVLLVVVVALLARPEPEVHHEPRGFTERGDATRSGVVSLAPLEPPTQVAWSVEVDAARTASTVRAAGDLVLERTGGGILAAREATTGTVRWLRRDLGPGGGELRVGDVVVISEEPGRLRAFGAADGAERWRRPELGMVDLLPAGDGLLVRSQDRLRSVDPATGEPRWGLDAARQLDGTIRRVVPGDAGIGLWLTSPPGLAPDSPRVEHLVALVDTDTGEVRFTAPLRWGGGDAPVAVGGRHVAAVDGSTVTVRTPDGRTAHELDLARSGQAAATGDLLVVSAAGGGIVGIDLRTGSERWSRPDVTTDVLIATDGLVITGAGTVIHAQTGRTLSTQQRLDAGTVLGERTLLHLPAIAGTELEVRDRRGATVARVPLLLDEAAAPAVGAGRVFVPTRQGVEAFTVADGQRSWAFAQLPTGPAERGAQATARTPAVADATVLVGPGASFGGGPGLVALELTGGVRTWDREGDAPIVEGPMTLAGDVAFLPVGGEIHGYDAATGRRAFAAVVGRKRGPLVVGPTRVIGGPAWRGGMLLTDDGEVVEAPEAIAILRRDRSENWRVPLAPCSGPVLVGERVAWGTDEGVTALDERTGEEAWRHPTRGPVCLDPVAARGRIVVVADPATLHALPAGTGGPPAWSTELPAPPTASPVLAGTTLLVPLLDGTLAGYDLEDGSPAWTVELGGVADASPTVLDGRVLVHLRDGRLLALTP